MAFLPADFEVPTLLETDRFRLRPISVDDLDMDYEAVMSSRQELWRRFGQVWGWPHEDLTVEQDRKDLRWHEEEFERRSSFDYAVMAPDESRLLGCVYIDPATEAGFDAEVHLWVRASEAGTGLEEQLDQTVRRWVADRWPFRRVAYPGREP